MTRERQIELIRPGRRPQTCDLSSRLHPVRAAAVCFEGTIDKWSMRATTTTPCPWRARTPTARRVTGPPQTQRINVIPLSSVLLEAASATESLKRRERTTRDPTSALLRKKIPRFSRPS